MSENESKTATEMVMKINLSDQHLEHRARRIAITSAQSAVDEIFKPEDINDMADVRHQVIRAAEMAAYRAVEAERAAHFADMRNLKAFWESRIEENLQAPMPVFIKPED